MSRVRVNIAANIAGQAWQVLLAVVCTPLYIKLLGIEAFGLIAFLVLVQSITQLLDLGLGTTVNREIARLSGRSDDADRSALGRVVGTIERWYWILGCILGIALFFGVPHLAIWWLQPQQLSASAIVDAAKVFGLFALLQWPIIFYQSGLLGLQRQFVLNAIQIPFTAVSSLGGLVFIWLGPRTVAALFTWQACMMLIQLLVLYAYFWKHIGVSRLSARVDITVVRKLWRFSLGMSGISLTGSILTHLDKMVLSRLLTLEAFGHYSLAGTLARGLYVLITPVFNAYFPRFSAQVSEKDDASMRTTYHRATQLMAVLVLPLAVIIALFAEEIAFLWLHNRQLAAEVAPIASLLVVGTCLNGLMNIPFALQLAHGKTKIGLYINVVLLLFLVPAIIFAATYFGAIGGAWMWAVVNGLYLAIGLPITHRYLLSGETKYWLTRDILPPLAIAIILIGFSRILMPQNLGAGYIFFALAFLWIASTLCASMSVNYIRNWGLQFFTAFLRSR